MVEVFGVVGIFGLSLGAGVGEEAMFRGFLMPWVDGRLESLGFGGDVASVEDAVECAADLFAPRAPADPAPGGTRSARHSRTADFTVSAP